MRRRNVQTVHSYVFFMERNAPKIFAYACVGTHGSCVRAHIGLGTGIAHTDHAFLSVRGRKGGPAGAQRKAGKFVGLREME